MGEKCRCGMQCTLLAFVFIATSTSVTTPAAFRSTKGGLVSWRPCLKFKLTTTVKVISWVNLAQRAGWIFLNVFLRLFLSFQPPEMLPYWALTHGSTVLYRSRQFSIRQYWVILFPWSAIMRHSAVPSTTHSTAQFLCKSEWKQTEHKSLNELIPWVSKRLRCHHHHRHRCERENSLAPICSVIFTWFAW